MTTPAPENSAIGQLAQQELQLRLPLQVCHSHRGYYIGTLFGGLPCSRESIEYYADHHSAYKALEGKRGQNTVFANIRVNCVLTPVSDPSFTYLGDAAVAAPGLLVARDEQMSRPPGQESIS